MTLDYSTQSPREGFEASVDLKVGEELIILVASHPSTGFRWSVEGWPLLLKCDNMNGEHTQQDDGSGPRDGTLAFTFCPKEELSETLILVNRKDWQRGHKEDEPIYGKVMVRAS